MKTRVDFVTNSSSASFLLAFKGRELTQRQKDAIVEYVLENALGHEMTDEEWKEIDDYYTHIDWYETAKKYQNKEGWTVRMGDVIFDEAEYHYGHFMEGLWQAIADADPEHMEQIQTDLSY